MSSGKQAILTAALRQFSIHGYDGTSIRKIAREADVDFTLITYYFKTKENLWREVILNGKERFDGVVSEHMRHFDSLSPGQRLRERMLAEYQFASSSDSLFFIVMNEYRARSERSKWIYEVFLSHISEPATSLIKAAQDSGEVVEGDPLMIYKLMQSGVRALLLGSEEYTLLTGKNPTADEQVTAFWRIIDSIFFPLVKTP